MTPRAEEDKPNKYKTKVYKNQASSVLLLKKQLLDSASPFPTVNVWLEAKDQWGKICVANLELDLDSDEMNLCLDFSLGLLPKHMQSRSKEQEKGRGGSKYFCLIQGHILAPSCPSTAVIK